MKRFVCIVPIAAVSLACLPLHGEPKASPPTTAPATLPVGSATSLEFVSNGKKVRVTRVAPANLPRDKKVPAVLILHGSGGGNPLMLRSIANTLAGQGYVAYVVYYMDATGHKAADLKLIEANFKTWLQAVLDGVTFVAGQDNVDAKRVALLGYSLGGYLSLSAGATSPERIAAVVEYFGGLPDEIGGALKTMPPTLILHGEADVIVPVAEARKLEKLLTEKKQPFEIKTYPKVGHNFASTTTPDGKDAGARALAFLRKHLAGDVKARKADEAS